MTYWAFLQLYFAEPVVGSVAGSRKCEHLWCVFVFLLKLQSAEPIVGSPGTYDFLGMSRTVSQFYLRPRSAIIILNKDRGAGEYLVL